jgi:hypothetical protein
MAGGEDMTYDGKFKSRQALSSEQEWNVMEKFLDRKAYSGMDVNVYDSVGLEFHNAVVSQLCVDHRTVEHLVYRCHGGEMQDRPSWDDFGSDIFNMEELEPLIAKTVEHIVSCGKRVVVWILSCHAGAAIEGQVIKSPKSNYLLIASCNKHVVTYDLEWRDRTRMDFMEMLEGNPGFDPRGGAKCIKLGDMSYPCLGNWSLYPFQEHSTAVDLIGTDHVARLGVKVIHALGSGTKHHRGGQGR